MEGRSYYGKGIERELDERKGKEGNTVLKERNAGKILVKEGRLSRGRVKEGS